MKIKKLTILGKSDATISLILNNLESQGYYPEISIINNLNLDIVHTFKNTRFILNIFNKLDDLNEDFIIGGYSPLVKKIAEKVKQLRIDKGYTSYENFAYENDLSRVQYWRLERGTNFTINYLLRILEIHQLSLREFFNDVDLKP